MRADAADACAAYAAQLIEEYELEELRGMHATPLDRFSGPAVPDRAPAPVTGRFDVCVEIGPPPRLA